MTSLILALACLGQRHNLLADDPPAPTPALKAELKPAATSLPVRELPPVQIKIETLPPGVLTPDLSGELADAKAEVARLKESIEELENQVRELKVRPPDGLRDKEDPKPDEPPAKEPRWRADGTYDLEDDSGKLWSNTDREWLVDWVTAVNMRLRRQPLPQQVPPQPAAKATPQAAMPMMQYLPQPAWQMVYPNTPYCPPGSTR